jgi:NADH-quinone oxidoreductase subunit L
MASSLILTAIGAPWLGALLVWLIGDRHERRQHIVAALAGIVAALAALLLLRPASWAATGEAAIRLPFGPFVGDLTFVADGLGVYLAVIATVVGSLTVIFSAGYMAGAAQLGRYYALVLIFIGAMCGLVLSGNLLFLFLFWEATAFCSYALIAFHNDDPKAVAAGIKALIITQLGGAGLLIGIVLAAGYLPDLQVSTLLAAAGELPAGVLAVVAFGFLLAAAAKSAQVPLHIWLPDAMEAPTPVSALIHAATMVNAGVYLLARFYPAFSGVPGWATTVMVIGVASALLAALLATTCLDLKRVLAYSTVSQLGYMVAGVGMGAIYESQFYLFSHALFKALLFLGAGAIIHHLGTRDMRRMGGLWRQMPQIALPFLIGAAALVGLPFFNGFWSKELLLETALERFPLSLYPLLVAGAGITAFYAARMCRMVFFAPPAEAPAAHHSPLSRFMSGPVILLAVLVTLSWLVAEPFAVYLRDTLPFHAAYILPELPIESIISTHTVLATSTFITLGVSLIGLLLGWRAAGRPDTTLPDFGRVDALFNNSAGLIARATRGSAALLQGTQTGLLNWNVAGVVLALIALLLVLILQGV